jgi:hypothetical protein
MNFAEKFSFSIWHHSCSDPLGAKPALPGRLVLVLPVNGELTVHSNKLRSAADEKLRAARGHALRPLRFGFLLAAGIAAGQAAAYDAPTAPSTAASAAKTTYAVKARSNSTHPESDPPRYVRNLAKSGIERFKDINWLDAGLDFRERYEWRENDIRRPFLDTDHNFLHRTRAYLGVREILDPLRFALEFEDARNSNSVYPADTRDVNKTELIQGYGELYFKGALGADDLGNQRPLRLRVGRMAWESVDRRLLANNQWRNTTNNFEGMRLNLGQEANDWEIDLWGVKPVIRDTEDFDSRNGDVWFYGGILNWRRWSDVITLQPYYMGLKQRSRVGQPSREVHSPGLRGFGVFPGTNIDFDLGALYQFGRDAGRQKSAWAYIVEFGYTFPQAWKPRLSVFYGYASGDRDPTDGDDNRFERFFGFARPWSADDNVIFENIKTPKLQFAFEPRKGLAVDGGYSWYWLASDRDRFNNLLNGINGDNRFNRDRSGASGDYLGQSIDVRVRYELTSRIDTTIGYSHWVNGGFVQTRQRVALGETTDTTNFLYCEVSISLFE